MQACKVMFAVPTNAHCSCCLCPVMALQQLSSWAGPGQDTSEAMVNTSNNTGASVHPQRIAADSMPLAASKAR